MKALLDDNHWEEIEMGSNSATYLYDFFFHFDKKKKKVYGKLLDN